MMQSDRKIIAVTGGIGSGKSAVSEILKKKGYVVLSCDRLVGEISNLNSTKREIRKICPDAVSGKIFLKLDKKILSQAVFSSSDLRIKLEDILHPKVLRLAIKRLKKFDGLLFLEVPILFERGYEKLFDNVIIVSRDKAKRIENVMARSNLSREEVIKRIDAQIDYCLIDKEKYIIINNDGDFIDLENSVDKALEALK